MNENLSGRGSGEPMTDTEAFQSLSKALREIGFSTKEARDAMKAIPPPSPEEVHALRMWKAKRDAKIGYAIAMIGGLVAVLASIL